MSKTIFITITKSFITRNILRSGTLDLLKKSGHKIIIFFHANQIPQYLRDEFEDEQVKLIAVQTASGQLYHVGPLHRRFTILSRYLLLTDTTKLLVFYRRKIKDRLKFKDAMPEKSIFLTYPLFVFLKLISKVYFFKFLFRFIELNIFTEKDMIIQNYFNKYNPDLIFSTSILSSLDVVFMKEAKKRMIKTVSMPKSWDNLTNQYYRFVPDYFLVQNEKLKEKAINLQKMPRSNIYVVGVPQFDWYSKNEIIRTREDHFNKKGLDPNLPLIFFGSEGLWTTSDHKIAEMIYEWIINNKSVKPCQLLVRPHYTNVKSDVFKNLRNKEKVVVDDYRIVDFLYDSWDQSVEETIDFTNSVIHCDIMINIGSTLALDAACADRPIISIGFGCTFRGGKDTTKILYCVDHNKWVLGTKAVAKVDSPQELKNQINQYLLNPKIKAKEREVLRKKSCYKVDGKSSERAVNIINEILAK